MGEFLISILKMVFGVLFLPLVVAGVMAVQMHLDFYPDLYQQFFMYGLVAFLLIFIFLYQFWAFYEFGQNIILQLLKFFAPFDRLASRFVPFYFTLICLLHYITITFFKAHAYDQYFLFFAGLFFGMHILLTAQVFQDEEKALVKPNYFFWMPIVFVGNVFLLIVLFDLTTSKFTVASFAQSVWTIAQQIYLLRFKELIDFMQTAKIG